MAWDQPSPCARTAQGWASPSARRCPAWGTPRSSPKTDNSKRASEKSAVGLGVRAARWRRRRGPMGKSPPDVCRWQRLRAQSNHRRGPPGVCVPGIIFGTIRPKHNLVNAKYRLNGNVRSVPSVHNTKKRKNKMLASDSSTGGPTNMKLSKAARLPGCFLILNQQKERLKQPKLPAKAETTTTRAGGREREETTRQGSDTYISEQSAPRTLEVTNVVSIPSLPR